MFSILKPLIKAARQLNSNWKLSSSSLLFPLKFFSSTTTAATTTCSHVLPCLIPSAFFPSLCYTFLPSFIMLTIDFSSCQSQRNDPNQKGENVAVWSVFLFFFFLPTTIVLLQPPCFYVFFFFFKKKGKWFLSPLPFFKGSFICRFDITH